MLNIYRNFLVVRHEYKNFSKEIFVKKNILGVIQCDCVKVYTIFTVARKHLVEHCSPHAILLKRLLYRDFSKKPAIFHSQFSQQPLNRF